MDVKFLNATHPEHDDAAIARREALYQGGPAWHRHVAEFVPKNAQEPEALYAERKERATYENHAAGIIDLLAAMLFSEAPGVEGVDPAWLLDVDRRRTGWAPYWRGVFVDALVQGVAFVQVALPSRPADVVPADRATEERMGLLRPWLLDLEAGEVIDWGEDEAGNLDWLVTRMSYSERGGPEAGRKTTWRWRYIDAMQIRSWEWTATEAKPVPTDGEDAPEKPAIVHGLGALPVVRMQLPAGLWAMGKLYDPVVAHTRADNDYQWSLHRAAHALMVLAVKDGAPPPTLGAGYYLAVTRDADGEDSVSYAEPSGTSFDAQAKNVQAKREEVYRVAQQMALSASQDATPAQQSGASKAMDWQALQVMLVAYADIARTAMIQVAEIVARIQFPSTSAPVVTVAGLEGWQQEDVGAVIADASLAVPLIPSPTYKRSLAKSLAARLLPDVDAATQKAIAAELDAHDFADPAPYVPPPRPRPGDPPAGE